MTPKRDTCLQCTRKHLSQARVLLKEYRKGYPLHVDYAIGHMGEAEDESVQEFPEVSEMIRSERIMLEQDQNHVPDFDKLVIFTHEVEREATEQQLKERGLCYAIDM